MSGQPPLPAALRPRSGNACRCQGRTSRSTLTGMNSSLMSVAISGFSYDSRSISWHQWHQIAPMSR